MNDNDSINKIITILKDGATKFHDEFDKNLEYYFKEEIKEDEVVVHFNITYGRKLEYLLIFKKQKSDYDHIPSIKGENALDLTSNPYKELNFTDENCILGNIYNLLENINYDEIACYKKYGIILLNPLELKGLYNINILYITD